MIEPGETKQGNITIDTAQMNTALIQGNIEAATLLVAHRIKQCRPTNSTGITAATEAIYSICARTYQETYQDQDLESFETMWAGVEDGLKRIFD
jgi:hypothetical protein